MVFEDKVELNIPKPKDRETLKSLLHENAEISRRMWKPKKSLFAPVREFYNSRFRNYSIDHTYKLTRQMEKPYACRYMEISVSAQDYKNGEFNFAVCKIPYELADGRKIKYATLSFKRHPSTFILTVHGTMRMNPVRFLSIDIGEDNLAACADSFGKSFLVDGRHLHSKNKLFFDKYSKAIDSNNVKRADKVKHSNYGYLKSYCDKSVSVIKKYCEKNGITSILIGKIPLKKKLENVDFMDMKYNLPNISSFCFSVFMDDLKNSGFDCIVVPEDYSSQCSFYDDEEVSSHKKFAGKRVKRAVFRTRDNHRVNADVNAAYNFYRKHFGDGMKKYIHVEDCKKDLLCDPKRIQIID